MKLYHWGMGIALLGMMACEEQIPSGLNLTLSTAKDTTYVLAQPETPQTKRVLIEELTGASCTNCPKGTTMLKDFLEQYPDRLVVTGIHSGFLTERPQGGNYFFPNADADALRLFFNEGDPGKPSATFDRVPAVGGNSDGKYFINHAGTGSDWISMLNARLLKTTPVNITLTSAMNTTTQKVDVQAKISFTAAFNEPLALTMYVLEDSIKDIQLDKTLGAITDYTFNHVFRKLITPVTGEMVLDSLSTKEAGRVLIRNISFDPNLSGDQVWNLDHCHVVGILHKTAGTKEVIHVTETHLK